MKLMFSIVVLFALAGCYSFVMHHQWEWAEKNCVPHEGVEKVSSDIASWDIKVTCNNGVVLKVNLPPPNTHK